MKPPSEITSTLPLEWDKYWHIPKPLTAKGLRSQARGICVAARAVGLAIRGQTPVAREQGRLRGVTAAVRCWIEYWWVLKHKGWCQ